MSRVYLGLGSNLGDRNRNLAEACRYLDESEGIRVIQVSPYHESKPVGGPVQDRFLNAAVEIETTLEPTELLERCLDIEREMGRRREVHWGPRVIDIDILTYQDRVIDSQNLTVPHPMMHLRRFVLEPLVEIAPDLVHATTGMTALTLLKNLAEGNGNKTETHQ